MSLALRSVAEEKSYLAWMDPMANDCGCDSFDLGNNHYLRRRRGWSLHYDSLNYWHCRLVQELHRLIPRASCNLNPRAPVHKRLL